MKKYLLFIGFILISFSILAQDVTHTYTLRRDKYVYGTGDDGRDLAYATDTMGSGNAIIDYVFHCNKEHPIQYYFWMNLDSTAGTPTIAITLAGRVFEAESWSTISTVNWAGTSTDTSIVLENFGNISYTVSLTGTDTAAISLTGTDTAAISLTGTDTLSLTMDTTAYFPSQSVAMDSVKLYSGSIYGAETSSGTSYSATTATGTSYSATTFSGTMTHTDNVADYRQLRLRFSRSAGNCTIDNIYFVIRRREH